MSLTAFLMFSTRLAEGSLHILGWFRQRKLFSRKAPAFLADKASSLQQPSAMFPQNLLVSSGYEFLQLEDAALLFEGRIYSPIPKNAVMEEVAKKPLHCEALLQTLMANADGDYSFLIAKEGWIGAGRDPVGVQPLYYGENQSHRRSCHKPKSPMAAGHRKPAIFSARKHRIFKSRRIPV